MKPKTDPNTSWRTLEYKEGSTEKRTSLKLRVCFIWWTNWGPLAWGSPSQNSSWGDPTFSRGKGEARTLSIRFFNKNQVLLIKRLLFIKENQSSQIKLICTFSYKGRYKIWDYRNHSFDIHISYLDSILFVPCWVPSGFSVRRRL